MSPARASLPSKRSTCSRGGQGDFDRAIQECSIPQDHIFGLLGLCDTGIVPDYSTPTIELYIKALFEGLKELHLVSRDEPRGAPAGEGIFIAILTASFGLRIEHPATFLVTLLVLGPTDLRPVYGASFFTIDFRHPQLHRVLRSCTPLLLHVCRLELAPMLDTYTRNWTENKLVTGPDGVRRTVVDWVGYVQSVLEDLMESRRRRFAVLGEDNFVGLHPCFQMLVDCHRTAPAATDGLGDYMSWDLEASE